MGVTFSFTLLMMRRRDCQSYLVFTASECSWCLFSMMHIYWCQRCDECNTDFNDIKPWFFLDMMFKLLEGRQWRRTGEQKLPRRIKMRWDFIYFLCFFLTYFYIYFLYSFITQTLDKVRFWMHARPLSNSFIQNRLPIPTPLKILGKGTSSACKKFLCGQTGGGWWTGASGGKLQAGNSLLWKLTHKMR